MLSCYYYIAIVSTYHNYGDYELNPKIRLENLNGVSCMCLKTEYAEKQTEIALRGISTNTSDIMVTYGMKGNPYNLCSIFHCLFPYLHTVTCTSQFQMRRVRIHALN